MKRFDHLIVGGGIAGFSAAQAIREVDSEATVGMFSDETEGPYDRTALSKALWQDTTEKEILFDLEELHVERIPRRAVSLDPIQQTVLDPNGDLVSYGKLLLAPGVRPRFLPFELEAVHYLHSLEQYRRIRDQAERGKSFLVIGGGFLGAELSAALNTVGNDVTMVFPEAGIGGRMFPADLATHVTQDFRRRGIDVRPSQKVEQLSEASRDRVLATLDGGNFLEVDQVIVAIGSVPRTELAWAAGIGTGNGILVDEYFHTDAPNVYAAGDVANYPDVVLGRRRVEHEDQAVQSGRHAGMAMAGQATPYHHLPLFYSDLFDYAYEAVGSLNPELHTFSQWDEPYHKGVTYYLDEGSLVRGVLMWNKWDLMDQARELVAMGTRMNPRRPSMKEAS